MQHVARRAKSRLLRLVGVTLWLVGVLCSGCTDLPRSTDTDDAMTSPITDTAAVYQVHGIRFAVPDGLEPVTDRYVFTDLPISGNIDYDPYNEITLFVDPQRTPQEIISDVMEGLDGSYDGPNLHNQRRTRIRDRMFMTASITYISRSRRDPSRPNDTTRVDYAFTTNESSGETWGFRLIPPDTTLTPSVSQDWSRMIKSLEPQKTSGAPFIGSRLENDTRHFFTRRYKIALPERFRMINDLTFLPSHEPKTPDRVNEIKRLVIFLRSSTLPRDPEAQTIDDLKQSFSHFDLSGVVKERTISGRPVQWIEIEPRPEQGRVRTATRRASMKTLSTEDYFNHVQLTMDAEYVVEDSQSSATPPDFLIRMQEMHEDIFQSIEFSE